MLPDIENLLVIQDRDRKIQAHRRELAQIPGQKEHADTRLNGDRAAMATAKEAVQANEVAMKNLELDIQTRQNTIARLKTQQFETRKNEEYRALGHEVERYQKEVTGLEDRELELMEKAEELKQNLKLAEAAAARTQELVDDEFAQLDERGKNAEASILEIEEERKKFASRVEPGLLTMYERIFQKKGDAAIVPLESQQCKGCHMRVTATTQLKAKAGKEVTQCENCGRILYYAG